MSEYYATENGNDVLTVTIPLDRFEALLDTETRMSVLRTEMNKSLENELKFVEKCGQDFVTNASVKWSDVARIMCFLPTFTGYMEKQKKMIDSFVKEFTDEQ